MAPFSGNSPNKTFTRTTGLQSGTTAWADTEAASRGIESADEDIHDQDLADAINTSLQVNGANKPTANIDWGAKKITNMGDPASAQDAATKNYVDTTAVGFTNFPVRIASTATVTKASAMDNGKTIDGTVLATNDRVLLKDQSSPAENGIWVVAASGAPARATDMDVWAETVGAIVNVTAGSANANTSWRSTSATGGTINSTSLSFTSFGTSITTPVSVANGGTGTTTAALAFAALKQNADTSTTGVVERATVAEVQAGSASTYPTVVDLAGAGDEVALSDGATVTVDYSLGFNFGFTIGGNRTLAASNYTSLIGRSGYIRVTQDGTGTRTLNTSSSPWVNASASDIVLSTTAAAVDFIHYEVVKIGGTAKILLTIVKAVG